MNNNNFNNSSMQFNQPSENTIQNQNMNTSFTNQPLQTRPQKKNNKVFAIIVLLIVVGFVGAVLYFTNQDKKEQTNNENPNNSEVENDNKQNNEQEENNRVGTIDKNTNTTYDENGAFLMAVEDVFTVTGRGTVVTGTVERGTIKLNDQVQIIGLDKEIITTVVTGVEAFKSNLQEATVGDNVGILLRDITREDVQKGQVIAKPNSIVASKRFDADVYMLTKEEDGRHTPFFDGYNPQFYFKVIDITGTIDLPNDIEMVMPGDTVSLTVTLENNVAMEVGTEFSIRESGQTVGKGTVTKVY